MTEVILIVLILLFGILGFFWSTEDLMNIVVKTSILSAFTGLTLRFMIHRGYI